MPDPLVNFGGGSLATVGVGANVTSLTLASWHGDRVPDPAALGEYDITVFDSTVPGGSLAAYWAGKAKMVHVTAKTGDVLTVVDGAQGTPTAAIPTADAFDLTFSKGVYDQLAGKAVLQLWTSSQSGFTPPKGWKNAHLVVSGGGGGGGSGPKSAPGQQTGAGGGQGGYYTDTTIDAASVSGTWNVTVGAGGAGGASRTGNNGPGNDGTAGGASSVSIGGVVVAFASGGAAGGFGGAGSGGAAGNDVAGRGTSIGGAGGAGASGGNGNPATIAGGRCGAGGGGAAGGMGSAPTSRTGGAGSSRWIINVGANLTTSGASATDDGLPQPGGSGAGGSSSITANGQAGGNGVKGGGGGGGGGCLNDLGNSGKGGDGGDGFVAAWFYF